MCREGMGFSVAWSRGQPYTLVGDGLGGFLNSALAFLPY